MPNSDDLYEESKLHEPRKQLTYEEYVEANLDTLLYEHRQELIEHWYAPHLVEEVSDGRDDFCKNSYENSF